MMRILVFFFSVYLLQTCRAAETVNPEALVRVGEYTLTRGEVETIIPKATSQADSLLMAENYVAKWVKDILTYEAARRNVGNEADIHRLVEEYRRSLITHRYQEKLIRSRLSSEIPETEKMAYYQENPKKFTLSNHLVKGIFLKAPTDAPGLDEIRRKYRKKDMGVVEDIEKFSIRNAVIYEYFYDRWRDFEEIMSKIPMQISNPSQYLKAGQPLEYTDSVYCYLLNISEYTLAGSVAPYEYALPQIQELMINKKKLEFLRNTEEELYRDAVRKGQVVFYNRKQNEKSL